MTQSFRATEDDLADRSDAVGIGAPQAGDLPWELEAASPPIFELRGEIARGGMGRIVEAWERPQGRPVALKFLLRRGGAAAERFSREARITARLQHPSIVPVYYAGTSVSGEPFYAMKLVVGRSLAEALQGCASQGERLALLPHVAAVTDALAYAHAQRVIHRDLKPSNVLLGAYGETVVIDWGLAKELGASDAGGSPLFDSEADEDGLTGSRGAIGTPRYMPPEQARGDGADERSDVYALGALLYHLLAGVPPYHECSSDRVTSEVVAGPPRPVEAIEPVPVDLAAIVRKAMARAPEGRYATAREMADDLRRYASGRLVSVHRYSSLALARRWMARRKAPLRVAAVLLAAMAVLGGVSLRRVVRERDRADAANGVAERAREAAVTQRDAAERLVGFVISDLRDRLAEVGRLDVLGGVGHEVDAYYQRTREADGSLPPGVMASRAQALETLAEVEDAKHDSAQARALYGAAQELRRRLVERRADDDARADLGDLLVRMARFEMDQQSDEAARGPDEEAKAIGEAIVLRDPSSARGWALASRAHTVSSSLKRNMSDAGGAAGEAAAAVAAARRLGELEGTSAGARRILGESLAVQARSENKQGLYDRPTYGEAVAVREALVAASPGAVRDRADLSESYEQRSIARRQRGDGAGALEDARRAVTTREELVARDPENLRWQQLLGRGYDTLATAQAGAHPERREEAIATSRRSVALLTGVADSTAAGPEVSDMLVVARQRLGMLLCEERRYREADEAMRPVLALAERFAANAKTKKWTSRLADTHVFLGANAFDAGDTARGIEEMEKALAIREPLEGEGMNDLDWINAIATRGTLITHVSDPGELHRLRARIVSLFVAVQREPGTEMLLQMVADACLGLLPTSDPPLRAQIAKAVELLLPMRVEGDAGASTAPRLATLAKARRLLAQ